MDTAGSGPLKGSLVEQCRALLCELLELSEKAAQCLSAVDFDAEELARIENERSARFAELQQLIRYDERVVAQATDLIESLQKKDALAREMALKHQGRLADDISNAKQERRGLQAYGGLGQGQGRKLDIKGI